MARTGQELAEQLTPREREVLALLREGLTNSEIAKRLDISADGAKFHVSEIIGKLGVRNRYEASAWPERPPWWLSAAAPIGLFARKLRGSAFGVALAGAAGVAVAVAIGALVWGLTRTDGGEADPPPTVVAGPERLRHLSFTPGETITANGPGFFAIDLETGAAEGWIVPNGGIFEFTLTGVSADGRYVLYTCREQQENSAPVPCATEQQPGLWYMLDTQTGVRTGLPAGAHYLSLSPDGETLLAEADGELVFVNARDNDEVRAIGIAYEAQPVERGGIAWSPDGGAGVVRASDAELLLIDVDSLDSVQLADDVLEGSARWSPDGSKVAITRNPNPDPEQPAAPDAAGILVFDREGELLWESALAGGNARWSPDSTRLAVQVDPPRVLTPAFAADFRLDVFDGETGDALYRIDGAIACSGEMWTADSERLVFGAYDAEPPFQFTGNPETGEIASVPAAGVPSPFDADVLIGFDGAGFTRISLTTGEVTSIAATEGVDPAWFSDHEPLFAGGDIVFYAPHGGHGGCGFGSGPENPPPLEFQYPPFAEP